MTVLQEAKRPTGEGAARRHITSNLRSRERLSDEGVRKMRALLRKTRTRINQGINGASGFNRDYLNQMKGEVNSALLSFQTDYADEFAKLRLKVEDLGTSFVQKTLTSGGVSVQLPSLPYELVNTLADFHADQIKGISRAAADAITQELSVGVMGGSTRAVTLANIGKLLPSAAGAGSIGARVTRIIRTEVNRIHSITAQSRMETAVAANVNMGKYWLPVVDARTRASHIQTGNTYHRGAPIAVDDYFYVGSERAKFPRDPLLSAAETINCRCVHVPVVLPRGQKPVKISSAGNVKAPKQSVPKGYKYKRNPSRNLPGGNARFLAEQKRKKAKKAKKSTAKKVKKAKKSKKTARAPFTMVGAIKDSTKGISSRGTWKNGDSVELQAIGTRVRSEVDNRMKPALDEMRALERRGKAVSKRSNELYNGVNDLKRQGIVSGPQYDLANGHYRRSMEEQLDVWKQLDRKERSIARLRRKEIKNVIEDVRGKGYMGVDEKAHEAFDFSSDKHKKSFDRAADVLPKHWNTSATGEVRGPTYGAYRKQNFRVGTLEGGSARAYHQDGIGIHVPSSTGEFDSVMLHEYGHRVEYTNRKVKSAVQEFLADRTAGEQVRQLREVMPFNGYRADELVKKDKFASPYIGKIYDSGATEVLSMGLEGVFYGRHEIMAKDQAMADFILGLLTGY